MRRWLSVLLLVLLPLLSSWSVASAYCADEKPGADSHIGHHVDTHRGDGADAADNAPDAADAANADASDAHCDHCHTPGATWVLAGADAIGTLRSAPHPAVDTTLRAPPASTPDRPNWDRFA